MTIMKSQFLRIVHKHGFSRGVFGTAEAPSNISSVPYTYCGGEVMSMSDMYCTLDCIDRAMEADKAGTWPASFVAWMKGVMDEADRLLKGRS